MSTIGAHVFRVLFESLHDGYFVHDVEGKLIEVNDPTCADLGTNVTSCCAHDR